MSVEADPKRDDQRDTVHRGDNLEILRTLPDAFADLVYVDPPFNTGGEQRLTRLSVERDDDGSRIGFGGRRYSQSEGESRAYGDEFDDYLAWLEPRLVETHRVMAEHATFYLHLGLPGSALRQSHVGRNLRPRVFPERDRVGL